jgi:hypothetical protein
MLFKIQTLPGKENIFRFPHKGRGLPVYLRLYRSLLCTARNSRSTSRTCTLTLSENGAFVGFVGNCAFHPPKSDLSLFI